MSDPMEQLDVLLDVISAEGRELPELTEPTSAPELAPKPPKSKYWGPRGPDERRVKTHSKRTYEVDEMWEVHHEIVRRLVLGQKPKSIADDLGVSTSMVAYTRNSPVVRDQLEIMKGARDADTIDLAKRIREDAPEALRLLEDIISGEVEATVGLRAREANNMMNRAGYSPVQNIKGAIIHGHYTSEEIDDIKKRAVDNGLKSGVVVDAETTEIKENTDERGLVETQK